MTLTTRRSPSPHPAVVPVLLALAAAGLAGCDDGGSSGRRGDHTAPGFTTTPSITPSNDPATPLYATVSLGTDEPAVVELDVDDGTRTWTIVPDPTPATDHELTVLGVKPDRVHSITVRARDAAGNEATAPGMLVLPTPPLPAGFPPLQVLASDPARMEPGVFLFATSYGTTAGATGSFVVMLDEAGEVVWYHETVDQISDLRRTAEGRLLYIEGNYGLREVDMLGRTVGHWWASNVNASAPTGAIPVALDTFHHEVYPLPAGLGADFLVLSTEMRTYTSYPASEVDPTQTVASAEVVGDVVAEVRRDGTVAREWRLLDLLDPYRMSYDSLLGFWDSVYGRPTHDWSHANALVLDPFDDSVIVSSRHQDALVKIARSSGELVWILGDPARWQMPWAQSLIDPAQEGYWDVAPVPFGGPAAQAPFQWFYHQHAPMVTPTGSILLFDNGNQRAIPPDPGLAPPERYSRAVEVAVDPARRTVRQLWSYGGPEDPFFSPVVGDADLMPATDNVLVTDGGKILVGTTRWARVLEVERGDATRPSEIVFEVQVRDDVTSTSWLVYRAEKLADVYP